VNKPWKWNMIVLLVFFLMKASIGYSDGWGAHVLVSSLILFVGLFGLIHGIFNLLRIFQSQEGSESSPFVLFLSLVFLFLTFGFGDCSYIMVDGEEHADRGIALHLPWHGVKKFAHNPIGGDLEFEAYVLRQENAHEPSTRFVLVTTKFTLAYERPKQIVRFPSDDQMTVALAQAARNVQFTLPYNEDYSDYAGAQFREQLLKDKEDFLVVEGYHFRLTNVEATAKLLESEEELSEFRQLKHYQEINVYGAQTEENPLKSLIKEVLLRLSE
jgi:hypothetical protein